MSFPYLITDNESINKAYRLALSTLTCNTVNIYDPKIGKSSPVLNAGMYYNSPWVRDTSVNLWNGAGLLCPDVTLNTVNSLVVSSDNGDIIAETVGQSWDVIIWVIGAWYQYLYTGDMDFLRSAYQIAENTITYYEKNEFDEKINLFRGPACYGDGVAAYPDIYAEPGLSGILAFAEKKKDICVKQGLGIPMFTLSTNCLYYYAYVIADKMAAKLNLTQKYNAKAEKLRHTVNDVFWSDKKGNYTYIYDDFGSCDFDETLGVSFAILFGIANDVQIKKIFENHYISPHGVPCVWPTFKRYQKSETDFGRHSGTVWPFIQGFFADAAAKNRRIDIFDSEFLKQTENALNSNQFAEIYHPITGNPYGGLQEDFGKIREWESQPHQTWSATAYLRNIFMDILGMDFTPEGIKFNPCGSKCINEAKLIGLKYKNTILNIHIIGNGNEIGRFTLNGMETEPFAVSELSGINNIEILLK